MCLLACSEQQADDNTAERTITIKENDSVGMEYFFLETVLRLLWHVSY
jgi:hypothetical protein